MPKVWLRYAALVALGLLSWAWAALWLERLPYFTDDYSRWLATAHDTSWARCIADLVNPWGGVDATWGFDYRPAVVCWFKLFGRGGESSTLYFAAKEAVFAALVMLTAWAAVRESRSVFAALLASLLLLVSHGVLASLSWAGDMAVLADVCMLGAVVSFAELLSYSSSIMLSTAVTIALSLLAMQTKGDGKLLGGIFAIGLVFAGREARRRGLLPTIACLLMALPLGPLLKRTAFLGNGALPGGMTYVWHGPSMRQLWSFTMGGAWEAVQHPQGMGVSQASMLWPLGWIIAALALLVAPIRWLANRPVADRPRHFHHLIAAWVVCGVAATSCYPDINPYFQHRYAIDLLVPLALLGALAVGWMMEAESLGRRMALGTALVIAAGFQTAWGLDRMLTFRESFGSVANIADSLSREMAKHQTAPVHAYVRPYVAYDYWPPLPGRETVIASAAESAGLPERSCLFSWDLPLEPDLERAATANGLSGAWIERFYRSDKWHGFLTCRAPSSPARINGRAAAKAGRWVEAQGLLTAALAEHDTTFERHLLGIALIQTGRYADAVRVLSPLVERNGDGPRMPRYNLALALLQTGRASESAALFERLVRESPRDADSLYNLGVAHRHMGDLADAVKNFRDTLALRANHPGALANLKELGAGG